MSNFYHVFKRLRIIYPDYFPYTTQEKLNEAVEEWSRLIHARDDILNLTIDKIAINPKIKKCPTVAEFNEVVQEVLKEEYRKDEINVQKRAAERAKRNNTEPTITGFCPYCGKTFYLTAFIDNREETCGDCGHVIKLGMLFPPTYQYVDKIRELYKNGKMIWQKTNRLSSGQAANVILKHCKI